MLCLIETISDMCLDEAMDGGDEAEVDDDDEIAQPVTEDTNAVEKDADEEDEEEERVEETADGYDTVEGLSLQPDCVLIYHQLAISMLKTLVCVYVNRFCYVALQYEVTLCTALRVSVCPSVHPSVQACNSRMEGHKSFITV